MTAQQGHGHLYCVYACMQEFICFLFLLSIIQSHSRAMTSSFIAKQTHVSICCASSCLYDTSVFLSFPFSQKSWEHTESEASAYWNKFSVIQCSYSGRIVAKLSLKVKGHLLTIPATFFTSVECHIHVFGVSLSPPEGPTLLRWRVMIFPHQTLPFRRGHSAPLTEFFTKKTHTNTCLYNPSLHGPPV